MHRLVLLRHGQSTWNEENRFTGWTDVDLSRRGIEEAKQAGRLLKEYGFTFDVGFCSVLKRAIRTMWIVLDEMDLMWLDTTLSWRLNERHYGALQGLNKAETTRDYGLEQTTNWRRSYDICPPAVEKSDQRYPGLDPRYKNIPEKDIPLTECLKDTYVRMLPHWREQIAPAVKAGKRVIITAHGNSLRALVKYLDHIADDEIVELNIPTGMPLIYELDRELKPIKHYYLGDQAQISRAMQQVANQAKPKT